MEVLDSGYWILNWRLVTAAALLLAACAFAPVASAQANGRSPEEAQRLYEQLGDQMFCTCGCREKLLSCSHNKCTAKEEERAFLHKLCENPKLDSPAIKQGMVTRFGNEILQVPPAGSFYPILAVSGVVLVGAFAAGFWVMTRREDKHGAAEDKPEVTIDPELEARIAKELKELD